MLRPNLDQMRRAADAIDLDQMRRAAGAIDLDQMWRAADAIERQLQTIDRTWLSQVAAGERYLRRLALQMRRHEERLKRRRARCEAMLAESGRCGRCPGSLSIQETKADGVDAIIGVSLVCNNCNYEKYPSPDFAVCQPADEFLDAAERLGGTPPFPASFNAYWACELYLRELGGYYYYADGDDEGEFRPPTDRHGLSTLRNRLPESRRARLDAEQYGSTTFLDLFRRIPNGLWAFLRYQEESLSYPGTAGKPQAHLGEDGRLLINEADIYEILIQLGRILRTFMKDEFRRNLC